MVTRQLDRNDKRTGEVDDPQASQPSGDITEREVEDIEERSSPRTPVIYEIVRRLGEEEMARPALSLWWSGVASGLSISFSLLAQSILQAHLPDESWRPLVSSLGYSWASSWWCCRASNSSPRIPSPSSCRSWPISRVRISSGLSRMWTLVFLANLAGTFLAALFCHLAPVLTPEVRDTMLEISRGLLNHTWLEMVTRGIAAGFLIAAMVWLIPGADSAIPGHHDDDLADLGGRLHAHRCGQHGGLHAGPEWRRRPGRDAVRFLHSGTHRECHRRDGAVRVDRLRPGHRRRFERNCW